MTAPDRPGGHDQQQAAELARIVRGATTETYAVACIDAAIAAARAAGEAAEAARWQEKIEAQLDEFSRETGAFEAGFKGYAQSLIRDLRALLDGG